MLDYLDLGLSLHGLLSPLHRYCAPTFTNVKNTFEGLFPSTYSICSDGLYQPCISFASHVPDLHPLHIPLGAFYDPGSYNFFASACNACGAFINTIFTHPTALSTESHVFPHDANLESLDRRFVSLLSVPLHGDFIGHRHIINHISYSMLS